MRPRNKKKYFSKSDFWLILGGTAVVASTWLLLRPKKAEAMGVSSQNDKTDYQLNSGDVSGSKPPEHKPPQEIEDMGSGTANNETVNTSEYEQMPEGDDALDEEVADIQADLREEQRPPQQTPPQQTPPQQTPPQQTPPQQTPPQQPPPQQTPPQQPPPQQTPPQQHPPQQPPPQQTPPQQPPPQAVAKYHWIMGGVAKPAPVLNSSRTKLINMQQSGGCDLTPTAKFRGPRTGPPNFLVIHWGGYDLNNLCNVFRSSYEASSNVGTGRDASGNPVIWQFLDLNAVAWHAGEWRNELSVGVDIAQDPTKSVSFYTNKGYSVKMMDNNTGRGNARCLTIDPVVKKATQDAIVSLCRLFGIPIKIPRGARGESDTGAVYYKKLSDDYIRDEFTGVLAHFHTSNNKWDIAPWWEEVMLPILD